MTGHHSLKLQLVFAFVLAAGSVAASAAAPPSLINYQGVLRDSQDHPLTGTYDIVFSFHDAQIGGNQLLVDTHSAAGGSAVTVTGGLFSVQLGGGTLTDGSGPGNYGSLEAVFDVHSLVYVEVQVGAETLSPRTRILAGAYAFGARNAQNADQLGGQPPSFYLDTSSTRQSKLGTARLESPDTGYPVIEAVHTGGAPGTAGYFADNSSTGRAWLAGGDRGIQAYGSEFGGYFESTGWGASVFLARDTMGLEAHPAPYQGSCAGRFIGTYDGSSHNAILGCNGGTGVDGYGNPGGHFHSNWGWTGEAFLGYGDEGIHGYGTFVGGYFVDLNSSAWVRTGYSTYKVQGSGTVSFVQNHPYDKGKVIVYAAPEGDEVAVYTRGTARLVDGEARVKLGETFALVANPDVGLSANVTPIDLPVPLAVVEKTTSELLVRGPAGSDVAFDYIVWGLRIGFESSSIVQPKSAEALVPSMTDHESAYAADPSLRGFNALERFRAMRAAVKPGDTFDQTRAGELLEAIGVYDMSRNGPVDTLPGVRGPAHVSGVPAPATALSVPGSSAVAGSAAVGGASAVAETSQAAMAAERAPGTPDATVVRPWSVAFPASAPVEPGDVVALDPVFSGAIRPADRASDRTVVGVALAPSLGGTVEVAVGGIAWMRVDASHGAVTAGDLLSSSPTAGAAMRAKGSEPGTILGKALEPLDKGIATIRVLLMAR